LFAQRRTRSLVSVQVVGAFAATGLYLALIPSYGGLGAARATLAAMVASCATAVALSAKPGSGVRAPAFVPRA
jgi:O-antigen/teichoic acid export membrane protein